MRQAHCLKEDEKVNVQMKLLHVYNLLSMLFNASVSCLDHVTSVIDE